MLIILNRDSTYFYAHHLPLLSLPCYTSMLKMGAVPNLVPNFTQKTFEDAESPVQSYFAKKVTFIFCLDNCQILS